MIRHRRTGSPRGWGVGRMGGSNGRGRYCIFSMSSTAWDLGKAFEGGEADVAFLAGAHGEGEHGLVVGEFEDADEVVGSEGEVDGLYSAAKGLDPVGGAVHSVGCAFDGLDAFIGVVSKDYVVRHDSLLMFS